MIYLWISLGILNLVVFGLIIFYILPLVVVWRIIHILFSKGGRWEDQYPTVELFFCILPFVNFISMFCYLALKPKTNQSLNILPKDEFNIYRKLGKWFFNIKD